MANATTGNKIYVDSTGAVSTTRTKITYIVFTGNNADDSIVLGETASGDHCLKLQVSTAKNSAIFDFSRKPLVFNNGVYVQTLSASATALLVTSQGAD